VNAISANQNLEHRIFLLVFVFAVPMALILAVAFWGNTEPLDDAYISSRYALNLIEGHGLVWNVGGEPTQGFTNFLFVILTAIGLKLGIAAEPFAYILNALGLLLAVNALRLLAEQLLPRHPFVQVLPPLAAATFWLTYRNLLNGLETLFWTGLVLTACSMVMQSLQQRRLQHFWLFCILCVLCALTRPESVLFIGMWLLMLLTLKGQRKRVMIGTVVIGAVGLAYAAWLYLYFGSIFPNSFYVKVSDTEALPGLSYVQEFVALVTANPLLFVGIAGLIFRYRTSLRPLLSYSVVLVLPVFYLFTEPLMGIYYRFLQPTTWLALFTTGLGLAYVIVGLDWAWRRWVAKRESTLGRVRLEPILFVLAIPLVVWLFGSTSIQQVMRRVERGPASEIQPNPLVLTGLALNRIPDVQDIVVAYGDAGAVPYFSRANSLDVIGLNENTIAREASKHDAGWVVQYVLDQHPDMIGIYAYPNGRIFNAGHGVIGNAYSYLYTRPEFQANYTHIGGVRYTYGVVNHWFVRNDSPHRDEIAAAIGTVASVYDVELNP
jgi:hypothetical protein